MSDIKEKYSKRQEKYSKRQNEFDSYNHKQTVFFQEVEEKNKRMDIIIDQINDGLDQIKQQAIDINVSLKQSEEIIEELDGKMDKTDGKMSNTNKRLKNLLTGNGRGTAFWCPIIICLILLLSVIGYCISII